MKKRTVLTCLLSATLAASPLLVPAGAGKILAAGDGVEISEKNFPDEIFRTYVKEQFDEDKDGFLSESERDGVENIDVSSEVNSGKKISSLQGIGFFTELQSLYCNYNDLTKLDLSKNEKLIYLDCHSNRISSLNLKKCSDLLQLSCARNKLTALDVSMFPNLEHLDCSENLLSSLDLSANTKLVYLDASYISSMEREENQEEPQPGKNTNHISKLVLGDKPELETFLMSGNKLTALDIGKCKKLHYVNVCDNGLTSLTWQQLPDLEDLMVAGNKLETLNLQGCPNLLALFADDNKLVTAPVENCPKLESISLNGNKIETIDLSKCTKAQEVDLCENKLTQIDLSKMTELKTLYLNANGLTSLDVSHNTQLCGLYVEDNKIETVNIGNCRYLEYIDLSYNKISSLDISKCPKLVSVYVDENKLSDLNVSTLAGLESLYCESNNLVSLDVSKNPKLTDLDCSHNLLKNFDLSHNKKIRYLCLGDNFLQDIKIDHLTELEYLFASGNEAVTKLDLPKNAPLDGLGCSQMSLTELDVSGYPALRTLYCEGNKLNKLDLSKNPDLENLNCGQNPITSLDVTNLPKLEYLICQKCPALTELKLNNPVLEILWVIDDPNLKVLDISKCSVLCDDVKKNGIVESADGRYFESYRIIKEDSEEIKELYFRIDQTLDLKGFELPKPNPGFEAFVERLYTKALNRESDPEGKKFWVDKVTKNEATGADCARFFLLDAPEFMARNLSNEDFLETLYSVFFDRQSDPEGKAFYLKALSEGTSKQYVVECFIESKEWCDVCAEFGVKSGAKNPSGTKPSKKVVGFVQRLYENCLGREADEQGLYYWSMALTNGQATGIQAARFFFGSKEMKDMNLDDIDYICRLYGTFFDRDPEYSGLRYWEDQLAAGVSRETVTDLFAISEEFAGICAEYGIEPGQI